MKLNELYNEVISEAIIIEGFKEIRKRYIDDGYSDNVVMAYIKRFKELKDSPKLSELKFPSSITDIPIEQRKNIDAYKDFKQLEFVVDQFSKSNTEKKIDKDKTSQESKPIYEKNGLEINVGDSKAKCILFGDGYSFCISQSDSTNLFYNYRFNRKEPTFYFIYDKERDKDDIYHMIVVHINNDASYAYTHAKNDGDLTATWDEILEVQPKLRGLEGLIKHVPLEQGEKDMYHKLMSLEGTDDVLNDKFNALTFDEKDKYIDFEFSINSTKFMSLAKKLKLKFLYHSSNVSTSVVETAVSLNDNAIDKQLFISVANQLKKGEAYDERSDIADYFRLSPLKRGIFDRGPISVEKLMVKMGSVNGSKKFTLKYNHHHDNEEGDIKNGQIEASNKLLTPDERNWLRTKISPEEYMELFKEVGLQLNMDDIKWLYSKIGRQVFINGYGVHGSYGGLLPSDAIGLIKTESERYVIKFLSGQQSMLGSESKLDEFSKNPEFVEEYKKVLFKWISRGSEPDWTKDLSPASAKWAYKYMPEYKEGVDNAIKDDLESYGELKGSKTIAIYLISNKRLVDLFNQGKFDNTTNSGRYDHETGKTYVDKYVDTILKDMDRHYKEWAPIVYNKVKQLQSMLPTPPIER